LRHRQRRRSSTARSIWLLLLGVIALAIPAVAQAPILEFSISEPADAVPQGARLLLTLQAENVSVYEADDLEVLLLEGNLVLSPVEPVALIEPFEIAKLALELEVPSDAQLGASSVVLEVAYTYCIGELCYQVVETLDVSLIVASAVVIGPDDPAVQTPAVVHVDAPIASFDSGVPLWQRIAPVFIAIAVVGALILGWLRKARWGATALLGLALILSFVLGFQYRQDQQAQSIGAVLCTSCVGIEEEPNHEPRPSTATEESIVAIDREIDLVFFTATWCQACPFAKATVDLVVALNPLIRYEVVDVEHAREAAEAAGVIRSGRTVVPAILRADTGEVLFGIEDLETRLLQLLEDDA